MRKFYLIFVLLSAHCFGQAWSTFLDPSRAIDWSGAGFQIPAYSVNCSTQPTLLTGSGNAAANATAIQNALASCDATHNVVNIAAGTWYVAGFHYGSQGKQVLRGAGASSTKLISTSEDPCAGLDHGVCMLAADWTYNGAANVQPGGANACSWTAGYAKGTTSITLSSCGTSPASWIGKTIVLDQANDASDTGGVYVCNSSVTNCTYDAGSSANGRIIGGVQYSMQQVVKITAVSGTGPYTVTISPGIYSTNIRTSQTPGAWYPGFVQNDGLENLTVDGTLDNGHGTVSMFSCYQCWVKGVTLLNGDRNSILLYQSSHNVIRDSYFFGAQSSHTQSYNIEGDTASDFLIENNIFQQVTTPMLFNGGVMGAVADYNYTVKTYYNDGTSTWNWPYYASHSADDNFNLFEGNIGPGISADNSSGPADQITMFRNMFTGWETGTNNQSTIPIIERANNRAFNIIGNVLGQPSYHTNYQTYALTSSTISGAPEAVSIYTLGLAAQDVCSFNAATTCDTKGFSTLMRWGNYDTVTSGVKWDSTEASPAAIPYANGNFSSAYFGTLAHTLPNSLYYSKKPSWWPRGKAWPVIGPDISSGNVGVCTGTYAGAQATSSGQCTGGTLSTAWASHVISTPAQDCFLSLGGKPDGSGSALAFNAASCYGRTYGVDPSMSQSTIQGIMNTADSTSPYPNTVSFNCGNYTGWTGITVPAVNGTIYTGPAGTAGVGPGSNNQWAKLTGCQAVLNSDSNVPTSGSIFTVSGGSSGNVNPGDGATIENLVFANDGAIVAGGDWATNNPSYGILFQNNTCQSLPGSNVNGGTCLFFHNVSNSVIQNNYCGDSPYANTGCYAVAQDDTSLAVINNFCKTIGQCFGSGFSYTSGFTDITLQYNVTLDHNRLAYEMTDGNSPGAATRMQIINNLDVLNPGVGNTPNSTTGFVSMALGPVAPTSGYSYKVNNNTTIMNPPTQPTFTFYAAELTSGWSWETTGNLIQGKWQIAGPMIAIGNVNTTGDISNSITEGTTSYSPQGYFDCEYNNPAVGQPDAWPDGCKRSGGTLLGFAVTANSMSTSPTATQHATTAPSISPATGFYTFPQTVTVSNSQANVTNFCTQDGSTPTTASPIQTTFISAALPVTIKCLSQWGQGATTAFVYPSGYGWAPSTVTSVTYSLTGTVANPTYSPTPGNYSNTQSVVISTVTAGASIVYTNDGTTPTVTANTCTITHGTLYTGPISTSTSITYQAIGCLSGNVASGISTGAYTINTPVVQTPTFAPPAGTYAGTQSVVISTTTPAGSSVVYTQDGSTPTVTALTCTITHGTLYTAPVSVNSSRTLKAIGCLSGATASSVATAAYVITAAPPAAVMNGTFTVTGGGSLQ